MPQESSNPDRTPATVSVRLGTLARWSEYLLEHLQLSGEVVLVLTSLLVGISTGIGAVLFNRLIHLISQFSFTTIPRIVGDPGHIHILIIPMIGGLIAGPLIFRFAREAKGHGVPEVMEAIALRGGRIRPIVVVIKALSSSVTIGSGGSVGREGPIVQIGSALGSTLGQKLHLSDERISNLVASGTAGGIAATFNAPIAGVIFAVEVIQGEFSVSSVGTVVLAAVTANAVTQAIQGAEQAFPVPQRYTIESVWEFGFYAVLGVLAALVAVTFVRSLYWSEDRFAAQKRIPEWLQPAAGGLLLGGMALVYPLIFPVLKYDRVPQVFGTGAEQILDALSNQGLLGIALLLLLLKIVATNLTLGSGGSGGIFAPALFMGAMLGVAVGILVNDLFPGIPAPPGAYALVGMAAVFSGAAHAPITAVVMLFELTGDYRIILPLMLTVTIATLLARRMLDGESIYTLKLARRGIRLQSGRDVDILQSITVREVVSPEVDTVPMTITLRQLSDLFSYSHHHGFPIIGENGALEGIVTVTDLDRAITRKSPPDTPVSEIGTMGDRLQVTFPDEAIGAALSRMGRRGLGRLPVVARDDPTRLLGLVRRADIIRGYSIALTRRSEIQHRTEQLLSQAAENGDYIEFGLSLSEGDGAVNKTVSEIAALMPEECILVSIERQNITLIPHGNTILRAGDHVVAFVRNQDVRGLYRCLHENRMAPKK